MKAQSQDEPIFGVSREPLPVSQAKRTDRKSTVSVLIATKNRPHELARAVQSVLHQTLPPQELLILDQTPEELGKQLVRKEFALAGPELRANLTLRHILDSSLSGLTAARNRLLKEASGDIVLFIDDDAVLEQDFIEKISGCYAADARLSGVSGIITNYIRPPWYARIWPAVFARGPFHDERQPIYWNAERLRDSPPLPVSKFTGASMSFRVDHITGHQFDEKLSGGCLAEDVDFCAALAPRVLVIAPSARLIHTKSPINRDSIHWLQEHAQSAYYLYRRHWRTSLRNRLYFAWLCLGYAAAITFSCARHLSLQPLSSFRAGIRRAFEVTSNLPPNES